MKVQEISSGIGPSKDKTETQFYQHQHQYQYSKSNSKCSNTSMASSFNSAYYSADQLAGVLSSKPSNVEDKTGISTGPKHDNNSYKNNDGSKSSDNCSNDNNRKRMDTTFTSTSTSTDKDMFPIDQHPEYKILMSKLKRSDDRVQILDEENYTLQMNVSELTTRLEQAEKTHRKERVAATKRGQAEKNYLIQQMAEKQKANEVLELQVKRLKAQVQRLGKEKKVVEDELCSLENKLAELQNSSAINNTNKQIVGVYNNNNGNDNGVTGATGMERMDSVLDITKQQQQQQQQQLEQELQDEQDIKNYQKRLVQLRRGNSYRINQMMNGANVCKEKPRRRKNTINSPRRGMRLRSITGESSLCSNVVQKSLDEDGVDGVDEWQDEEQDVEKMLSKQLAISMLEDTNNNNKNDDDNDNENENDNINNNNSLDSEGGIYQRVNKSIEEGEEYTNLEIEMKKAIFQHSKVLKRTGNSMRQKGGMMRMKRVVEYSEKQTQTEDQNQDQNQKEEIEVEVENSGDKDSSIMTIQTATDSDIAIVMVGQNANANANTNANVNVNKFKTKYAAKSKQLLMLDNTSYEFVPTKKVIEREINKYKRDFNVPQTNTTAKITTTNNNNNNASRPVSIPSINIKSSSNSSYSSNSVIDKVDINIKTAEKQMGNRFSRISNSQHATLLKSLVKTSYSTSLLAKKNNAHINNYNNNNNDNNDSKQKVIDPKIVNVLSKVMMGTYMYKFSTNSSSSSSNGNNENNMYYFTVHPYSKTLSWAKQPMNESQKGIKTMYIDSVRVVADYQTSKYLDLCSYSLIISDSKNQVKIKASNAEDHDSWYLALSYLQSRRPKSSF